ncbi:hypothetical protein ARMSODRAFT_805311 [Armillaria solidipes]|uniref:Uncharacterized protein n=1 Tax=Armillaria solidipes TaxID=1076256 RepID=A0A2H3B620_9AGAR|nr:hypothetical protein ARMSODRAFT_805311 [Armillaria solidipes]
MKRDGEPHPCVARFSAASRTLTNALVLSLRSTSSTGRDTRRLSSSNFPNKRARPCVSRSSLSFCVETVSCFSGDCGETVSGPRLPSPFPEDNRERSDEDGVEPKCARKESKAVRIGFLGCSRVVSGTSEGGVSALDLPFVSGVRPTALGVLPSVSVALDLPFRSGGSMTEVGASGTFARAVEGSSKGVVVEAGGSGKGDDALLALG